MLTYFNTVVAFFLGLAVFTLLSGDSIMLLMMIPGAVFGLLILIPLLLFSRHLKEPGWDKYPFLGFCLAALLLTAQSIFAWQRDLTPVIVEGRSCDMEFQFRKDGTCKIILFEMLDTKVYYVDYRIAKDTLLLAEEGKVSWNTIKQKLYWKGEDLRFHFEQAPNCSATDNTIHVTEIDSTGYVEMSLGFYKGEVVW